MNRVMHDRERDRIAWKNPLLFSCCVYRTQESVELGIEKKLCCELSPNLAVETEWMTIVYLGLDGTWRGTRNHRHDTSLPAGKKESASQQIFYYILDSIQVQDFLVVQIIAMLKPEFVDQLCSYSRMRGFDSSCHEYNAKLSRLFEDLLPSSLGERISYSSGHHALRHVLYLEYESSLAVDDMRGWNPNHIRDVQAVCTQIGAGMDWLIPAKFGDSLILSGAGVNNRDSSCVVVQFTGQDRVKPFGELKNGYYIPRIPLIYLNHVAVVTIVDYCRANLIDKHIVASVQYRDLGRSWSSFDDYRTKYLDVRLETEQLIVQMEELPPILERYFSDTLFYTEGCFTLLSNAFGYDIKLFEHGIKSLPLHVKDERLTAESSFNNSLAKLKSRMSVLDGFLRDSGIADVTDANLRLARSVKSLTWVVTVIAVLTFIVTIIPDATKSALFSRILSNTSLEWLLDAKE